MHDSDVLVGELLEAGARAYLLKSDAKQYLIAAVEALADHKPFFTGRISQQLLDAFLATHQGKPEAALSPRERVIVQLIAEGHSNREMSEILNLSVKTVETHRAAAMRKLESQIDRRAGALRRPQSASGTVGPNHHDSTIIVIYLYLLMFATLLLPAHQHLQPTRRFLRTTLAFSYQLRADEMSATTIP